MFHRQNFENYRFIFIHRIKKFNIIKIFYRDYLNSFAKSSIFKKSRFFI